MLDGFYRMTFTGTAGSGFGIVAFRGGAIAGADVAGATFDGSYKENSANRTFDFQITMHAPAGVTPVQTGIALAAPMTIPINGSVAEPAMVSNEPILLQTPLGPVNILFKKIRDI